MNQPPPLREAQGRVGVGLRSCETGSDYRFRNDRSRSSALLQELWTQYARHWKNRTGSPLPSGGCNWMREAPSSG